MAIFSSNNGDYKSKYYGRSKGRSPEYDERTEQFFAEYLTPERIAQQKEQQERQRRKQAKNRVYYARSKEKKAGGGTAGKHERIKYLMQQLDKGDRDRIRKGIYDDSDTQIELAEKILVDDGMTDEEISQFKEENDNLWYKRNAETLKRRGGLPKPKPPRF